MQEVAAESLLDEVDFLAELATLENGVTTTRRRAPVSAEHRADEPDRSPSFGRVAAVSMFVLLMTAGAAGAALVFHERVARMVATW